MNDAPQTTGRSILKYLGEHERWIPDWSAWWPEIADLQRAGGLARQEPR